MLNFEYYNPTRIVFGKGTIAELGRLVPAEAKVLLFYGGGSVKRSGVYGQVRAALGERKVLEFGGIEPNPAYETCMKAVEIVRDEGADFLVAAGGGSVLDAAKFVAVAAPYTRGDPWVFLEKPGEVMPEAALPLGAVLTLPATGSEMNPIAVISRKSVDRKVAFVSELMQPRFSILDPEATFSLPQKQVRNGIVDTFIHVVEQYMTYPADAPLQDRQAEAVLMTLVEEGPKTLADPQDYNARANLMWCATNGLNKWLGCGVPQDFATHMIGHELTVLHGLVHAEALAVVLPALWRHQKEKKKAKLAQYARRIWHVSDSGDSRADDEADDQAADQAIERTVAFFHSLGMPTGLSDYGVAAEEAARRIGARLEERGVAWGEHGDVTPEAVAAILRAAE